MNKQADIEQPNEPWIRTMRGGVLYPLNPTADQIFLDDIAAALSKICRYNGRLKGELFYSVAEHCVLLADYVIDRHPGEYMAAMQVLLHDAAEAYIGDLIRPIKGIMPEFSAIEDRLLGVIYEKYGVEYPMPDLLHRYDTRILRDEERLALNAGEVDFSYLNVEPLGIEIEFMAPAAARLAFLDMFKLLADAGGFHEII